MLALIIPGLRMGAGLAPTLVVVPDVVGETQAQGTTDLQADAFVVAVATAYSASVAAGTIISQSPVGGSLALLGSTVTITVSLGPQPITDQGASGGWLFHNAYEAELQRRRARERKRREVEEETEQIADSVDRNIAQLMREQEAIDDRHEELSRLDSIAQQNADIEAAKRYSERVARALERAIAQGNYSALAALDRELKRARDEEDVFMTALMMLLD